MEFYPTFLDLMGIEVFVIKKSPIFFFFEKEHDALEKIYKKQRQIKFYK